MLTKDKINKLSEQVFTEVKAIRRHIHKHPELSFEEKNTAAYVQSKLEAAGYEVETGIGGFGLTALLKGEAGEGKCLGLRADMDALPIQEANNTEYVSRNPGVMHACGHDVHTASLLGTAMILSELKDQFKGMVKFIFQPGEEKLPGGASLMIADGVLENPQVDMMLGQHVFPDLPWGNYGFCAGPYMASTDEIYVSIIGKGGHGAMPHKCVDPIVIMAQFINQVQTLVSRKSDPLKPVVLTFGKVNTRGGATNIIPDQVDLEGTFRAMDEEQREELLDELDRVCTHLARATDSVIKLKVIKGYPSLTNDTKLTDHAFRYAKEMLGDDNTHTLPKRMTAEDFAYFSNKVPACFYRMGIANEERGINSPVHTNTFDIEEKAFETSSALMAFLAIRLLNESE